MSFFELFRILFAVHFVLGIPYAFFVWMYIPGAVAILGTDTTIPEAVHSLIISGLAALWYYVWYGSIVFALSGRCPIFSIRVYSIILAIVYAGLGVATALTSRDAVTSNPFFLPTIVTMMFMSMCGITFLPKLKMAADMEDEPHAETITR